MQLENFFEIKLQNYRESCQATAESPDIAHDFTSKLENTYKLISNLSQDKTEYEKSAQK